MTIAGLIPYGSLLAIPLSLGLNAISGVVNTGSRARRRVAVAIALLTLIPPFLPDPEQRFLRFSAALVVVLALFRALDLYLDRRDWSAKRRAWLMVAIFDVREAEIGKPFFDTRHWLKALAFIPPTLFGAWLCIFVGANDGSLDLLLVRWLGGTIWAYCSFEVAHASLIAGYGFAGVKIRPAHFHPILSRSVAEFWGRRWNMIVHAMLRTHCFRPLARRGHARWGVAAAFFASAAIHFWLMLVPLDLSMAASMGSFFLIQGALMLVERRLRVDAWRRPLAHAWAVVVILGSSPLFTEPVLRVLWEP